MNKYVTFFIYCLMKYRKKALFRANLPGLATDIFQLEINNGTE